MPAISQGGGAVAVAHPLDPLTHDEIVAAVEVLRANRDLPDRHRFVTVTLHEPSKEAVLAFEEGDPIDREAFNILLDNERESTFEAVVSVTAREVGSWKEIPGVQPPIVLDEFDECEQACKDD